MTTFIGIDLAWQSDKNPSGAAVLRGDEDGAELIAVSTPIKKEDVLIFVQTHLTARTVVAIDAPLIISTSTGQRFCETLVGRHYGARHASCHSTNHTLYPNAASVHLANQLALRGFNHVTECSGDLLMLEVYPHSALVELFELKTTIKYKKGPLESRRVGLRELRTRIVDFSKAEPPLRSTELLQKFIEADVDHLAGRSLKHYEDGLDSLVCAYLAYYFWRWRSDRTQTFGDVETGYIVNPSGPLPLRAAS